MLPLRHWHDLYVVRVANVGIYGEISRSEKVALYTVEKVTTWPTNLLHFTKASGDELESFHFLAE